MDDIDRRLLRAVQRDGRASIQALAERIGLSSSPCLRRLRRLERDGLIRGYTAILDQRAVGLPVSAFVSVKLERQRDETLDRFARAVADWEEVVEAYLMTGNRDYLLRVACADLEAYERFLRDRLTKLEGVASIETSLALKQVKAVGPLPL